MDVLGLVNCTKYDNSVGDDGVIADAAFQSHSKLDNLIRFESVGISVRCCKALNHPNEWLFRVNAQLYE